MAITRRSAITKDQQQQQQQQQQTTLLLPPPPPSTAAEPNPNSNNTIQQPQQQQQQQQEQPKQTEAPSGYEQTREQRIKENRERLQKLGIVDLSHQLRSVVSTNRTPKRKYERKTPLKPLPLASPESIRRSSRLKNAPPVTYTEPKEEKSRKTRDIVLEEGAKPELYTEEHDKLLGHTEMPWTFFVDGYRADGTRIYDPVNGKTCHQCRQKTLGQRTRCSKCSLVQGQFCGDCLMMRYGEHVVEANQNPNWLCPPCRGICNCSLCRQAKGWYPTGALYKRISNLGFKSVAHYLIATKRAPPESENSSDAPQPAKRSLPFEGMELASNDGSNDKAVVEGTEISPQSEDKTAIVAFVGESDLQSEGVGRSRKKSKKETEPASNVSNPKTAALNESNSKPAVRRSGRKSKNGNVDVEGTEISLQSEDKTAIFAFVGETDPQPEGVGRSRKRSKKETEYASNMNNPKTAALNESNSKPAVRRSGRKSKNGNGDVEGTISPQPEDKTAIVAFVGESDPQPEGVGRSRKKSKKETESASDMSNPKTAALNESNSKPAVRRSGRKSKNGNVDVSDESVKTSGTPGDDSASTLTGPNSSDT